MSITQIDKQYVAGTYNRFPVEITHGRGSECWDDAGKRYIDMGSGIGVTAFGYADEAWQAAVTAQLGAVQHTSNLYYTEPCAKLAQTAGPKSSYSSVAAVLCRTSGPSTMNAWPGPSTLRPFPCWQALATK